MQKNEFNRALLRLRYSPFGKALNGIIKAHFAAIWSPLRDLAIRGHEPTKGYSKTPSRWSVRPIDRSYAELYTKDAKIWMKRFKRALRS